MLSDKEIDDLKTFLREGRVYVEFTKVNGDKRTLNCTLNNDLVPKTEPSSNPRKLNDNVLAVYDLDNNGWRSFRLDSVITFGTLI